MEAERAMDREKLECERLEGVESPESFGRSERPLEGTEMFGEVLKGQKEN